MMVLRDCRRMDADGCVVSGEGNRQRQPDISSPARGRGEHHARQDRLPARPGRAATGVAAFPPDQPDLAPATFQAKVPHAPGSPSAAARTGPAPARPLVRRRAPAPPLNARTRQFSRVLTTGLRRYFPGPGTDAECRCVKSCISPSLPLRYCRLVVDGKASGGTRGEGHLARAKSPGQAILNGTGKWDRAQRPGRPARAILAAARGMPSLPFISRSAGAIPDHAAEQD